MLAEIRICATLYEVAATLPASWHGMPQSVLPESVQVNLRRDRCYNQLQTIMFVSGTHPHLPQRPFCPTRQPGSRSSFPRPNLRHPHF